jgi:acyl-CoA reductase-like NAD-dependent aldehyde dehydrogenase
MNSTTPEQLAELLRGCRVAQQAWAQRSVSERMQPVRALRRLLVRDCDRLAEAVMRDTGKPAAEVIPGEILPLADACKFLERQARRILKPRRIPWRQRPLWMFGQRDRVERRPRGVVAIIGTWNFPYFLNGVQLVQALTAGNGVVWKPSEVTPASADALFELVRQAGFPPDLCHKLEATRQAGPLLLEADIDHVVFTGAETTGRKIAARLGERLISSTMELSGCDAMFVLDDADVELAAKAAWFGVTINKGQTCIAVRRAFVPRSLYPRFLELLQPFAAAATPVPLALAVQARQAEQFVQDAVDRGGQILGSAAVVAESDRFRPIVIADATPEMAICREAAFAPVMAVLPYESLDDALRMDAQCPFGLGASIFTKTPHRAAEVATRLHAGIVTVNDVIIPTAHPAQPFGGVRASGWGTTQGEEGLLEMTVPQVVSTKSGRFRPHYDLATGGGGDQAELGRGLLQMIHGTGLVERLRGLWRALKAFRKRQ